MFLSYSLVDFAGYVSDYICGMIGLILKNTAEASMSIWPSVRIFEA